MTGIAYENIPQVLKDLPQWCVWRREERPDKSGELKPTKVPYNARTGRGAQSNNDRTWSTFEEAVKALESGTYDGLGFMLKGLVGMDQDKCRNPETGEIEAWALENVRRIDSYTEISPSGKGLRTFVFGKLPDGRRKMGRFEIYNSVRFLTVTGNHLAGTPTTVNERDAEIAALHAEISQRYATDQKIEKLIKTIKKNEKVSALWEGKLNGHSSQSEADLALCSHLAFYAGNDKSLIATLFRKSKLYRPKWDELRGEQTYGEMTIAKACERDWEHQGNARIRIAPSDPEAIDLLTNANYTDAGNAECLALLYANQFRYCHTREKWLFWDGNRWAIDTDGSAERAALEVARARQAAAIQIDDLDRKKKAVSWGLVSESNAKRTAMLQTAAILEQFATTVDKYDRDPMLAAVSNGTIDLRTGTYRAAEQRDYLSMQLGTAYEPHADCPRWRQFLTEVFAGDHELIAYVQRAAGYSLTGDTSEQKLFLGHGGGANGKSVFLEILSALLGEYAGNASFETFDAGRRNEATNDLAALKGKRLVTVIETEEDRRLAESRVKAVTGQDTISCRFLYGEFFTYRPQFKIWMAMNHKPIIKGTDRGIWRRVKLVPFTQNFEGREDHHLADKLRAELPGILNWALAGLKAWQEQGLGTAAAIEHATEEYRKESDLVGQWLDDCVVRDVNGILTTKDALESYREWCRERGYREPNERALGRRMVELDIETGRSGAKGRFYRGIRLADEGEEPTGVSSVTLCNDFGGSPLSESASRKVTENNVTNDTNDTLPPPPAIFTLTDDWQEVPDGVALPPGADIRMDFASGKNYARRLGTPGSNGHAAPSYQGDYDHDQRRAREVEEALKQGDVKEACKAAERIRGKKKREEMDALIAQHDGVLS